MGPLFQYEDMLRHGYIYLKVEHFGELEMCVKEIIRLGTSFERCLQ